MWTGASGQRRRPSEPCGVCFATLYHRGVPRGQVYAVLKLAVFLYGSEVHCFRGNLLAKLRIFHNKCCRVMCRQVVKSSQELPSGIHGAVACMDHEASPQSGLGVGCALCSSSKKMCGLSIRAQARRISIPLSFSVGSPLDQVDPPPADRNLYRHPPRSGQGGVGLGQVGGYGSRGHLGFSNSPLLFPLSPNQIGGIST